MSMHTGAGLFTLTVAWAILAAGRSHAQCPREYAKLTGWDTAYGNFGKSVAISGDVAVVRAAPDSCPASFSDGAVYFFRFDGSAWTQQAMLCAPDAGLDWGARSLAVSGDWAMMGAAYDDCAAGNACGAVYAYQYDAGWAQMQKLSASDPGAFHLFRVG